MGGTLASNSCQPVVPVQSRGTARAHHVRQQLPLSWTVGMTGAAHVACALPPLLHVLQVIDQGARLVDMALANGKMFELPGWKLISQAFAEHTVHFIGLLSDGGVHSRYDQLVGCVKGAVERGAKRIRVHILTGQSGRGGGRTRQWCAGSGRASAGSSPQLAALCSHSSRAGRISKLP